MKTRIIFTLLVVFLLSTQNSKSSKDPGSFAQLSERDLRKLYTEFIKQKLLDSLGLKEPPKLSRYPPKLSREAAAFLAKEYEYKPSPKIEETRVAYSPVAGQMSCRNSSTEFCEGFLFEINSMQNYLSAEIRIHKSNSVLNTSHGVSFYCFYNNSEDQLQLLQDDIHDNNPSEEWRKYSLSLDNVTDLTEYVDECVLEIEGIEMDHEWPLLIFQKRKPSSRERRNTQALRNNCFVRSFIFSFADIQWDYWIITPKTFDAKICTGHCHNSPNNYTTIMMQLFQNRTDLAHRHDTCFLPCCKPKTYENMNIIYVEESKNRTHDFVINPVTDLIVESCECS